MLSRTGTSWVAVIALAGLAALASGQQSAPRARPVAEDAPAAVAPSRVDPAARRVAPILLRAGEVRAARPERDLPALARKLQRDGGRAVIQLDGPMTPERRERLEAAGVRLGGYIPENAFIADLSRADGAALGALEFVQWQAEYAPAWKRDPSLGTREFTTPHRRALAEAGRVQLIVTLFAGADVAAARGAIEAEPGAIVHLVDELAGEPMLVVTTSAEAVERIGALRDVQFIEEAPELTDRSNSANRWIVQSDVPNFTPLYDAGLHGEGQIVGVIDGATPGLDLNHCSFRDLADNTPGPGHRKVVAYNGAPGTLTHATHVAGTLAGDYGVDDDTRGVAWAAKLAYAPRPAFQELTIYNAFALHHAQGARIHSNSWGDDAVAWYTSMCRGLDAFAYDHEEDLLCFAVTNSGFLKTPENAKNVLAVGAAQPAPNQGLFCSGGVGPTGDGRRKPEIYAPGCLTSSAQSNTGCGLSSQTGTSMACPAIAGAATLVRQYYMEGFYPTGTANAPDAFTPSAALLKATLLNSTQDMIGLPGYPGEQEGWGRISLDNTIYFNGETRTLFVRDIRNADGLSTGDVAAYAVEVTSPAESLRITLAWTEPPATLGAAAAQVNDLDLVVLDPNGVVYRGNVFVMGQSAPGGERDDRNNVEQVRLNAPATGVWTIRVRAAAVNVDTQGFALVASGALLEAPAPLAISLTQPPSLLAPGTPLVVRAHINPGDDMLVGGSAMAHYRTDGGAFSAAPLVAVGGDLYEAELPGLACGQALELYVAATGASAAGPVHDPPGAVSEGATYLTGAGETDTLVFDDFDADSGWTSGAIGDTATSGQWARVEPIGTSAQPDFDASPGAGDFCWVTGQHVPGQADGFADVDGGATTLRSPIFDLSDAPNAVISYARWFYTNGGGFDDALRVDISHDGGSTWFNVETIGTTTDRRFTLGGWYRHSFEPAALVPALTDMMRLRFVAMDGGVGTVVEAAIDDFVITRIACAAPSHCQGNANGDTMVDFDDITAVLANWGTTYDPGSSGAGDANNDGSVDFDDVTSVLANWGAVCP